MRKGFWRMAGMVAIVAAAAQLSGQSQETRQEKTTGALAAHDLPGAQQSAPDDPAKHHEMSSAQASNLPLKVTFGDKTAEWTAEKLATLPHISITLYNEHVKVNQTYSGVPLIEVLKTVGVPDKPHGKDFRLYLVAAGSDGYEVVYSVAEATPDVHEGTLMVADALDGKPLGANGQFQLVATGEKRPARWVRNLVAVMVKTAN